MEEQLAFPSITDGLSAPILDGEKRLLEMVASGRPLREVLEATCGVVESQQNRARTLTDDRSARRPETDGIVLRNCPPFIRAWITRDAETPP